MWQQIPWQEVIVGVCVLLAVIVVIKRVLPGKSAGSCGSGCGGCSSKPACSAAHPRKSDGQSR